MISPTLFSHKLGGSSWLSVSSIVIGFALLWLILFVALDLRDIIKSSGKLNDDFPLKNVFVIFVLGYVMF